MSDLRTRVINGDFESKLPYPSKSDFDRFYVYNKGQVIENGVRFDDADTRATKTAEWKRLGYTVEIVNDTVGLRATRNAYNDDVRRLEKEFKAALEDDNGMTGHPKADILFSKAWDHGHANGYAEVITCYDDLIDLVK